MQNLELSLIYPDLESLSNGVDGVDRANIPTEVLDEIQLTTILDLKSGRLCDFFTKDIKVIEYRQQVFADMIENPELCELFERVSPILSDISELRRLSADSEPSEGYLYSITEIELYVSAMELLSEGLYPMMDKFKSTALITLAERIKELTSRINEVKSVTIGVNLNAQLRPEFAGVLSVNNEKFKSGELLEKILRLDFRTNEYTCISSLIPFKKGQSDNQQTALTNAFNSALTHVFKTSMRSWKKVIQTYVL
ncbi:MAG: hypothetical protein IJV68_00760, partial [Clostridia bacterium]|nr:hypothetical protein [Clostridia bacterium]